MSGWGQDQVSTVQSSVYDSPKTTNNNNNVGTAEIQDSEDLRTQWPAQTPLDYARYNEVPMNASAAQGVPPSGGIDILEDAVGGRVGRWHHEARIYEWNEEYGDIGPAHEELEKQLFGSDNHVKSGTQIDE